ncbi:MAG: hypothetical protein IT289_02050 [Oligoflexia bacterium]|nr:hypothetical protein [Oligoflexia bacterium]
MANFFSRLFGKKDAAATNAEEALRLALDGVIEKGAFDVTYSLEATDEGFKVDFSGPDSGAFTGKDGVLLDAFQIFLKRIVQHKFPGQPSEIAVDCDGYMEDSAQELQDLAERLKGLVLQKGQPAYVRALAPRDRKVVHRYLAQDERVKSQSIGEGFAKKIKISLAKNGPNRGQTDEDIESL